MLKQIVANDAGKKQEVGEHIAKLVISDVSTHKDDFEFLNSPRGTRGLRSHARTQSGCFACTRCRSLTF